MKFKEYFVGFLKKFDGGKSKITVKDVEDFAKGLETLRGSNSNSEGTD